MVIPSAQAGPWRGPPRNFVQWEERGYSEKKERRAANPLCVCPDYYYFF